MAIPGLRVNPVGLLVFGALVILGLWYVATSSTAKESGQDKQDHVDLRELLSVGIRLAELAGERVKEVKDGQKLETVQKGLTKQGAKEFTTLGDSASQAIIVNGFRSVHPELQVISEEVSSDIRTDRLPAIPLTDELKKLSSYYVSIEDVTIWVDPLDATQEYTESLGPAHMNNYVTVMICVAVKGAPVIGIIRRPLQNEEYGIETVWGWNGRGVSETLRPVPHPGEKTKLTLVTSRSHAGDVNATARRAFGADTEIVAAGGSGYKVLQVCRGKASAYLHVTEIKKWDICAGNAIVAAVGGRMTTLKGAPIDYSSSANPVVSDGLLVSIRDHQTLIESWSKVQQKTDNDS